MKATGIKKPGSLLSPVIVPTLYVVTAIGALRARPKVTVR